MFPLRSGSLLLSFPPPLARCSKTPRCAALLVLQYDASNASGMADPTVNYDTPVILAAGVFVYLSLHFLTTNINRIIPLPVARADRSWWTHRQPNDPAPQGGGHSDAPLGSLDNPIDITAGTSSGLALEPSIRLRSRPGRRVSAEDQIPLATLESLANSPVYDIRQAATAILTRRYALHPHTGRHLTRALLEHDNADDPNPVTKSDDLDTSEVLAIQTGEGAEVEAVPQAPGTVDDAPQDPSPLLTPTALTHRRTNQDDPTGADTPPRLVHSSSSHAQPSAASEQSDPTVPDHPDQTAQDSTTQLDPTPRALAGYILENLPSHLRTHIKATVSNFFPNVLAAECARLDRVAAYAAEERRMRNTPPEDRLDESRNAFNRRMGYDREGNLLDRNGEPWARNPGRAITIEITSSSSRRRARTQIEPENDTEEDIDPPSVFHGVEGTDLAQARVIMNTDNGRGRREIHVESQAAFELGETLARQIARGERSGTDGRTPRSQSQDADASDGLDEARLAGIEAMLVSQLEFASGTRILHALRSIGPNPSSPLTQEAVERVEIVEAVRLTAERVLARNEQPNMQHVNNVASHYLSDAPLTNLRLLLEPDDMVAFLYLRDERFVDNGGVQPVVATSTSPNSFPLMRHAVRLSETGGLQPNDTLLQLRRPPDPAAFTLWRERPHNEPAASAIALTHLSQVYASRRNTINVTAPEADAPTGPPLQLIVRLQAVAERRVQGGENAVLNLWRLQHAVALCRGGEVSDATVTEIEEMVLRMEQLPLVIPRPMVATPQPGDSSGADAGGVHVEHDGAEDDAREDTRRSHAGTEEERNARWRRRETMALLEPVEDEDEDVDEDRWVWPGHIDNDDGYESDYDRYVAEWAPWIVEVDSDNEDERHRRMRANDPGYRGCTKPKCLCSLAMLPASSQQLAQPLFHDLPALDRLVHGVPDALDLVPRNKVIRQLAQVALLALPLAVAPVLDAAADDNERRARGLDLGLEEAAGLPDAAAKGAVFLGGAAKDGAANALHAERRDDAEAPQAEAGGGVADAVQQVLVQRVDEHDAGDVAAVAGGEDATDEGAVASGHADPGASLASESQGLGERVGGHAGGVGGWRVVGPAVARAVPVAVARDGAVLDGGEGPLVKGALERGLTGLKQNGGYLVALGILAVADAVKMDGVLAAVDGVAFAVVGQAGVDATEDQCGSQKNGDGDEDDQDSSLDQNANPLTQSASCLGTSGQTFFFLALTPGDDTIGHNTPDGNEQSPNGRSDAGPAFVGPDAVDGRNYDDVGQQQRGYDAHVYAESLGRAGEEDEGDEQVAEGETCVGEVGEAGASRVHVRRRNEDGDQQQHPPDKGDGGKEHGQVAEEADGPQVVWGDLAWRSVKLLNRAVALLALALALAHRRVIWVEVAIRAWRRPVLLGKQPRPLRRLCCHHLDSGAGACICCVIARLCAVGLIVFLITPHFMQACRQRG
ncbi:hypothetical protein FH972_025577 [Carpinus fangiana]|uniref:Uncharacterized protein n=1 Tax=Carpinus fangiana TaxID=176857 RepID=A0A5N6L1F0_9ROSI|nr:hypothetical protein FH972_025577 [Carpinus fangiana]